jgi:hypothetical protein
MRMAIIVVLASALVLVAQTQPPAPVDSSAARTPILVELFTSEGCSDCPPADAFLQELDQQPYPGAEMIVLSEHVDYWNHDGWKDPYSSNFYSERQAEYAREFGLKTVYTPQMVVDGSSEFAGSHRAEASGAFAKAATAPTIGIRLSSISVGANTLRAHLETAALPKGQKADVYVVVALNHAESQVSAGENAGRRISHTAVARIMKKVGSIPKEQTFAEDVELKLTPELAAANLRLVAFIQEGHQGKVLGATEQAVSTTRNQ